MRTVKLQFQTSADGYISGPGGEMDWMTMPWSADMEDHVGGLWKDVDTIVLGRKLAETFIPAWESRPEGETDETVDQMVNTPKVVFSRTLKESPWDNATIAAGSLAETMAGLKAAEGGDIMVSGGGTLAQQLIAEGLIDEIHLFANPVSLGGGLPVFPTGARHEFTLARSHAFECGVAGLTYLPRKS
ncbi:dihydrofolate reductase family protein [Salininema proteolyticum]|uniref:Dihydrofolate reductase family protein n=1 Tax=Salininema proteolyticum TaxID=1607685 RepID=A0ABV8TWR6_9ACTN